MIKLIKGAKLLLKFKETKINLIVTQLLKLLMVLYHNNNNKFVQNIFYYSVYLAKTF